MFPLLYPIIAVRGRTEEQETTPAPEDGDRYQRYRALLTETLSKYGRHEWTGRENTDPFSPAHHYICRKGKKSFDLFPGRDIAEAEIESEPRFAEPFMDTPGLTYNGFEIRVIDPVIRPLVDEFSRTYKAQFGEEPIITP